MAKNISELGKAAIKQVPGLKLSISDRKDYDQKVQKVNRFVELTCHRESWGFIKHSNIKKSHLNKSGLHLNRRGTAVLAKHFKHCTKSYKLSSLIERESG